MSRGTSPISVDGVVSIEEPSSAAARNVQACPHARLHHAVMSSIDVVEDYVCTLLDRRDHMFESRALGSSLLELEIGVAKSCLELANVNAEGAMKLLRCGDWQESSLLLSRARSLLRHCGSAARVEEERNEERFIAEMLVPEDIHSAGRVRPMSSRHLLRVQSMKYRLPSGDGGGDEEQRGVQTTDASRNVDYTSLLQAATVHRRFQYLYSSASDDPYGLGRMLSLHPDKLQKAYRSTIKMVEGANRMFEESVASGRLLFGRTQIERELLPPGWPQGHQPRPPRASMPHRTNVHPRSCTFTVDKEIPVSAPSTDVLHPAVADAAVPMVRVYFPRHRLKAPTKPIVTSMGPDDCTFGHGAREAAFVAAASGEGSVKRHRVRGFGDEDACDSELDECGADAALSLMLEQQQSVSKKRSDLTGSSGECQGNMSQPVAHSPVKGPTGMHLVPRSQSESAEDGDGLSGPLPALPHSCSASTESTALSRRSTPTSSRASSRSPTSLPPSQVQPSTTRVSTSPAVKREAKKRKEKPTKQLLSHHNEGSGDFPTFVGTLMTLEAPGARARRKKMSPRRRGMQKRRSILLSQNLSDREKKRILLHTTIRIQRWFRRLTWWVQSRDRLVSYRFEKIRARRLIARCFKGFNVRHHLATTFLRDRAVLLLQYAFRGWRARKELVQRSAARDFANRQRERSEGLLSRVVQMMGNHFFAKNEVRAIKERRNAQLEARIAREADDMDDVLATEVLAYQAAQSRLQRRNLGILSRIASIDPNLYHAPTLRAQEEQRDIHERLVIMRAEDEAAVAEERAWAQCIIAKYVRRYQCRAEIHRRRTEEMFSLHFRCLGAVGSDMVTPVQVESGRFAPTLLSVMNEYASKRDE